MSVRCWSHLFEVGHAGTVPEATTKRRAPRFVYALTTKHHCFVSRGGFYLDELTGVFSCVSQSVFPI